MLLKFSVENYKGIGKQQTLNLLATPKNEYVESLLEIDETTRANSYACVIGPNGSGKTHFLESLMSCSQAILSRDFSTIKPFILNDEFRSKPTSFELTLFSKELNELHNYTFSIYKGRVVEESLLVKKNESFAKSRLIFNRKGSEIKFASELKELEEFIVPNLDTGGLVTSFAASIKNDNVKFIHEWANSIILLNPKLIRFAGPDIVHNAINRTINEKVEQKVEEYEDGAEPTEWIPFVRDYFSSLMDDVCNTLVHFDIPIESLKIQEDDSGSYFLTIKPKSNATTQKAYTISEAEEFFSEGTYNALCLLLVVSLLKGSGKILLLDEIDGTFHHKLTQALIDKIRHDQSEMQLIVATHDVLLLDYKFRRDAVFAVTKNNELMSEIERASEFSIRKDAKLSSKYFSDEFGALPRIISSNNVGTSSE
ncbi:AAA family ATPase [Photobacterium damselae]|uniref:AAA family ATPase n=1 Tax=Photobacterium damselae TaxID=38293 RepID=UPI000E014CFA|nr:AAA family ATPase [Photobacterium damselae]SUB90138.1 Predicted ATPase [Photobacterium damselae]